MRAAPAFLAIGGVLLAHPGGNLQAQACTALTPAGVVAGESRIATMSRTVHNRSRITITATAELSLPAGWRMVLGGEPFTVGPESSATWVVGLRLPQSATAGTVAVPITITGGSGELGASHLVLLADTLCVQVVERRSVHASVTAPTLVIAGDSAVFQAAVRNAGNAPLRVRLRARSTMSFRDAAPEADVRTRIPASAFLLGANDSTLVRFVVRAPGDLTRSAILRTTLDVIDASDSSALATVDRRSLIVPAPGRGLQQAPRMAVTSTTRFGAGGAIAPVEVAVSGAVGDSSRLDIMLRGPTMSYTALGERSEYRIQLATTSTDVFIGDQSFTLSPLVERSHGAFGAALTHRAGRLQLSAFGGQNRWWLAGGKEAGARIAWSDSSRSMSLQAHERWSSAREDGSKASVQVGARGAHHRIEVEAAGSLARSARVLGGADTTGDGTSHGWAVRGKANVRRRTTSVELELRQATASFPGDVRGARTGAVELRQKVGEGELSVLTRSDETSGGFLLTPTLGVGALQLPVERRRLSAISLGSNRTGALTVQLSQRAGTASGFRFDADEQLVRVNLGRRHRALGASVIFDVGKRADAVAATSGSFTRFVVNAEATFRSVASVGLFGEAENGQTLWAANARAESYGANTSITLLPGLRFIASGSTSAQQSVLDGAIPLRQVARARQLDGALRYEHAGREFTLRTRVTEVDAQLRGLGMAQSRLTFLEYRQPFGLALPFRQGHPDQRVRVVDAGSGRPLAGALVRRGDAVGLTGKNGEARLPGTGAAGGRVELLAPPPNRPDLVSAAVAAQVSGNRERTLVLPLVPYARIAGVVATVDDSVRGSARVMLTNGRDTLFARSGANGAFAIDRVAPGAWQVFASWVDHEGALLSATESLGAQAGEDAGLTLVLRTRQRNTRALAVTPAPTAPAAVVAPRPPAAPPRRRKAPSARRTPRPISPA